jgi:serine/threonine-protein kinase
MPHRERAPQEITPVRIEAAPVPVVAPRGAAARPTPGAEAASAPNESRAAEPPPTMNDIEHDVAVVRRRALATAAYGVGTIALVSTAGIGGMRVGPEVAVPAVSLAVFFGVATLAGTFWTWLGARRLGDAGVSVFDAFDGAWRGIAARAIGAGETRGRIAPGGQRAVPATAAERARLGARGPDVHRVPATPAVLASRWGKAVTRAVEDRAGVAHLVDELGPADREMIPDVLPTADMLVRRVGELATTLHELDRDAPESLVSDVAARLQAARRAAGESPSADDARRIELLGRQVDTLADLVLRREHLSARLEGAGLLLQNMRLDLLRLRSAGIEAALGELTSATREAGALNRDIGRALDVADELRGGD